MHLRLRWALAASALTLPLMLIVPMPAKAQVCDLLNALGACTTSESGLDFNPDGTISLPGAPSSPAPSTPPAPSVPTLLPEAAYYLLDLANQERARVGAPRLVFRDDLMHLATVHTQKMLGSNGGIFHNLDLLTKPLRNVLGALAVGENVGWSTHLEDLHPRLMASPAHRAALLDPRFTVAGFAVMHDTDGKYYVTQDFVQPSGATPPPPPAPPAPPAPAPAPALRPTDTVAAPVPVPARVAAPAPAPAPVAAETVAGGEGDSSEESGPPAGSIGVGLADQSDGGAEHAVGTVAGLISNEPAPASPGRSGPAALALALAAASLSGLAWTVIRHRGSVQAYLR